MAELGTLHDAFIDELRDAYDAEKQLLKALPQLARSASNDDLRQAFVSHLEETRGHVEKLAQVFASLDEKPRGKHCDGIAGIIEEGQAIMQEDFDDATMDACLIAAGQRAEHYEMAAYGTLVAWATAMGHDEASALLEEILEEEKAADQKLTDLAEGGINALASEGAMGDQDEDEDEDGEDNEEPEVAVATAGRNASPASTKGQGSTKEAAQRQARPASAGKKAR